MSDHVLAAPAGTSVPQRARGSRVFLAAWAVLFALTGLWSLATPISASPDEPAHMVKAASVARGEFIGEWSKIGHVVEVPKYVAYTHTQTCYAFKADEAADCSQDVPGDPSELIVSSTTAGLYNPLYYTLVGWPTLIFGDSTGVYAMRLVSGLIFSGLLALSFGMLAAWRRPSVPLLAASVAVTPMVLFLGAAVNPNGFEVAAVLAAFVGMLSVTLERTPHIGAHSTIVALTSVIALNARGLSPLWLLLAVVLPLLLLKWSEFTALIRTRAVLIAIGVIALAAIAAIAWIILSGSLTVITVNADPDFVYPGTGAPPYAGFTYVIERTFEFGEGLIGVFGWLDTPAPLAVYFLWAVLCGVLILTAMTLLKGRRMLVAIALIAAFVIVPALVQAGYVTAGGLIWQGRYNLPMFVCMVVGLGALASTALTGFEGWQSKRRFVWIVVSALAVGHIYAFATALRRYAVGEDGAWSTMLRAPEWQPPGGNIVLLVLFALLAVVGCVLTARVTYRVSDGSVISERR